MHSRLIGFVATGVLCLLVSTATALADDAKGKPKVTYADQVSAIFRARCNTCHNADKQKGGLSLETYTGAMQGGGSGKVVEPGDSDASSLLQQVMHKEEPKMPPNSPKIPDAEIDVIRLWIEGGALEASGSVAAIKTRPKFEFKLDPSATGKPVGPPAMPENLPTEPAVVSARPSAVVALATSPWAPLVAIGGHRQVLLYNTTNNHLSGVLPFPEGSVNVLKFSRNGALLLAGGGRGGQSGLAVVWDVKSGKRVFEISKEYDSVLAADISPDHGQVALGGPGKVVRVYGTADGELMFEMKKHTEWITALEFSPDGVLLATGDRNNGLLVWEAQTGREFFDLRGHAAAITDISWRLDSNVMASSSEDGTVKLWEMENGNAIKSWGAHGGGTASVRFARDGRVVTAGRDRLVRLWDQNGAKQRDFEAFSDLALEAVFSEDQARVIAGDWTGEVRVWDIKDGERLANLVANPAPLAIRLERARTAVTAAHSAADAARSSIAPLADAASKLKTQVDNATQALAVANQDTIKLRSVADAAAKALMAIEAEEANALKELKSAEAAFQTAITEKHSAIKAIPEKNSAEKAASEALAAAKAAVVAALVRKAEQDTALAKAVDTLKIATTRSAAESGAADLAKQAMRATELAAAVGLAGSHQAASQARWEQVAQEKTEATKVLELASKQVQSTEEAAKHAQASAARLAETKAGAAKAHADARAVLKAGETLASTRKSALEQATAARAAADKVLADRKAAADASAAALNAAKTEAEALAAEKQQLDASKRAIAVSSAKSS
jgi:hypothetical protein